MTERIVDLGYGYRARIWFYPEDAIFLLWVAMPGDPTWREINRPVWWRLRFSAWPLGRLHEAMALAIQRVAILRARAAEFTEQYESATTEALEVVQVWQELESPP